MSQDKKKWYAVYTKPRWEKKVDKLLKERGIESYCPLTKVRKKWSDRYKIVEEPLFKSYGFVLVSHAEMQQVRMVNGVVNFVYWDGSPGIIRDKEIENIRCFLNEYVDVQAVPIEVEPNSKVLIKRGVMMNHEAKVLQVKSKSVEVLIECLGYKLIAQVEKKNITPILS